VVIKVSSPSVTHKSEWGDGAGVAIGLESREAVQEAAEHILNEARSDGIDANILVEESLDVDAGTEVIVGGLRDHSFGPVVMTGLGGIFTEIYEDTAHRIAPIDQTEAWSMLEELTAARLLKGFRAREKADLDALTAVIEAVSGLLVSHDEIAEIDINPMLADDRGATALDALVVLDERSIRENDWDSDN
jgi:succinyl-CoA synthetase beta subunit